ncbi:hypothetical protein [Chitinophaga sp. HK235]|uniref:hypothetical protein n=1 Tax=Chitinophaga sp. HK235 TaxID=2952571 RepID=UPI001BA5A942|nr:hypothetical protein [Chitinophaga sp. HK235]
MVTAYFITQCIAAGIAMFAGLMALIWYATDFFTWLFRKKKMTLLFLHLACAAIVILIWLAESWVYNRTHNITQDSRVGEYPHLTDEQLN